MLFPWCDSALKAGTDKTRSVNEVFILLGHRATDTEAYGHESLAILTKQNNQCNEHYRLGTASHSAGFVFRAG